MGRGEKRGLMCQTKKNKIELKKGKNPSPPKNVANVNNPVMERHKRVLRVGVDAHEDAGAETREDV